MTYLVSDLDAQAIWAKGQGALAANANVDPAIYSSVMSKALDNVKAADIFAFNYDLATTPPMAEGGLNMFAKFMDDPSGYPELPGRDRRRRQRSLREISAYCGLRVLVV